MLNLNWRLKQGEGVARVPFPMRLGKVELGDVACDISDGEGIVCLWIIKAEALGTAESIL
jgi:hypothetical protein